jgi:transketolase
VLSNGHASILQYSLLYLSGLRPRAGDLKQFRQFESRTPGHPRPGTPPASRSPPAPSARVSPTPSAWRSPSGSCAPVRRTPIDHHTFVIAGDGC